MGHVVPELRVMRNLKAAPWLVMVVMAGTATDATAQRSPRFPTVLWASCAGAASDAPTGAEPISLHEAAVRARPMLWFSRDEPLMAVSGPMPREWPQRSGG